MSQVDQKRALNKLKHNLEPFRNIILQLDSILTWQKNFYPAIVFGINTIFYLILWWLDLSTITMLSLAGLIAVGFDFVYPSISRILFNAESWEGSQEEQFEEICKQLCNIKTIFTGWYDYIFTTKERKSTMFVIIVSITLVALAWIGSVINNLFLMYLVTLAIFLYPGIQKNNIIEIFKERFGCVVSAKYQQLREKANKKLE